LIAGLARFAASIVAANSVRADAAEALQSTADRARGSIFDFANTIAVAGLICAVASAHWIAVDIA
jgi:hypothetical protein